MVSNALLLCLAFSVLPAFGVDDHRVDMKIDHEVDILPKGPPTGMMKLVRAPDGTIYLNTQSWDSSRKLLKSTDDCQTWSAVPVNFNDPSMWPAQTIWAFTVTRDGRLWAVHQATVPIFHRGVSTTGVETWPAGKIKPFWVSRSSDGGLTWKSTRIDFDQMDFPGEAKNPYVKVDISYSSIIERPDGTVMFAANMWYSFDYERKLVSFPAQFMNPDPSRRGLPYVMIRTKDGGKTWGDPTFVRRWAATETDFAVDPKNPDHILAMSRKQRGLIPGEDKETVYKQARATLAWPYPFKGSQLLESNDGGRTFEEVPNAYTGFYGHRGAICWTPRDVVIATYLFDPDLPRGAPRPLRGPTKLYVGGAISLNGGKTWVDGTRTGTTNFEKSKRFVFNPPHGGTTPTIEVAPNRYFTAFPMYSGPEGAAKGFFWHLVDDSGRMLSLPLVKSRADAPAAKPAADKARKSAIRRQRRLIFNNDGDDIYWTPAPATKEGFYSVRMGHMANTGVDSVFYYHLDPTPFYTVPGRTIRNAELNKLGTDSLKLAIDICRKNNMEIFWTYRLNDIHDANPGPDHEISPWKRENRHLMMGKLEDQKKYPSSDPRWYYTFLDYAQREVRDVNVAVVKDILNRYDVDGIDLDFLRHPAYFKETMLLQPVTQEHTDMLTDMVAKIRREILAASKRKDKPILLSVRILPTLELNRRFGFDIERWLKDGTIDLITVGGGYDPFTASVSGKEMIDFGHAYDVPVYACLSRSGFQHAGFAATGEWEAFDGIEHWRAAAANAWAAGADGITTFNLFPSDPDPRLEGTDPSSFARLVWSEIGDPQVLAGKDKLYCIENLAWCPTVGFMRRTIPQDDRLPVILQKRQTIERILPVGDDLKKSKNIQSTRLRIRLSELAAGDVLEVWINSQLVNMTPEKPSWLVGEVDPSVLKKGSNILAVTYQAGSSESLRYYPDQNQDESSLKITSVELAVDYKD